MKYKKILIDIKSFLPIEILSNYVQFQLSLYYIEDSSFQFVVPSTIQQYSSQQIKIIEKNEKSIKITINKPQLKNFYDLQILLIYELVTNTQICYMTLSVEKEKNMYYQNTYEIILIDNYVEFLPAEFHKKIFDCTIGIVSFQKCIHFMSRTIQKLQNQQENKLPNKNTHLDLKQLKNRMEQMQNELIKNIKSNSKQFMYKLINQHNGDLKHLILQQIQNKFDSKRNLFISDFLKQQNEYECRLQIKDQFVFKNFKLWQNIKCELVSQKHFMNSSFYAKHLVVLVHGYKGKKEDLNKIQSHLLLHNPNLMILMANYVQKNENLDIEKQGYKLAQEVISYLKLNKDKIDRISFIGFSLGGVIIRACLKHLESTNQKFFVFLTYSSPHLGIKDKFLTMGLWILQKIQGQNNSIQQLMLYDDYMIELSKDKNISKFCYVITVGSVQDKYCTYESSLICKDKQKEHEKQNQMVANLLKNLQKTNFIRVHIQFDEKEFKGMVDVFNKNIHMQFLQNDFIQKYIMIIFGDLFN